MGMSTPKFSTGVIQLKLPSPILNKGLKLIDYVPSKLRSVASLDSIKAATESRWTLNSPQQITISNKTKQIYG